MVTDQLQEPARLVRRKWKLLGGIGVFTILLVTVYVLPFFSKPIEDMTPDELVVETAKTRRALEPLEPVVKFGRRFVSKAFLEKWTGIESRRARSIAIIHALHALDEAALPALLSTLESSDHRVRETGLIFIESNVGRAGANKNPNEIPDQEAVIDTLIDALDDEERSVRVAACRALSRFGPYAEKAIPKLVSLVTVQAFPQSIESVTAISTLGEIGPPAGELAVPVLLPLLDVKAMEYNSVVPDAMWRIAPEVFKEAVSLSSPEEQ